MAECGQGLYEVTGYKKLPASLAHELVLIHGLRAKRQAQEAQKAKRRAKIK